jgi:TPR repeat protein
MSAPKFIYGQYCQIGDNDVDEDIVGPLIDSIDIEYERRRQIVGGRNSGSNTETNDTKNEDILSRAEQGDAEAQYTLGNNYHFGIGVKKDVVKARRWYLKTAENGHSEAQYDIGYNYEKGRFVSKSLNKAFNWYRKAAAQANARAQYKIGLFYEQGWSVQKDLEEALEWYKKAASQGHALAGMSLDRLQTAVSTKEQASESDGAQAINAEVETPDISERLRKVKQLLDEGLITEAEAAEKRKAILAEF